ATPVLKKSRVGKRAVTIPKGVTVNLSGKKLDISGPKGKLVLDLPANVAVRKDGESWVVESNAEGRDAARLQGLSRALLASMVKGAAEGYERSLELVGTGYRAEVKGKLVTLSLGFSHPTSIEL